MLAKEPKFIEFILSPKKILRCPRFLKYPGYYPEFLKHIFEVFSTEREVRLSLIIGKQDVTNIVKQSNVWARTPFIREKNLATKEPVRSSTVVADPAMSKGEDERPNNSNHDSQNIGNQSQFQKVKRRRQNTFCKSFDDGQKREKIKYQARKVR